MKKSFKFGLLLIALIALLTGCSNTKNVKSDNIKITVLGSEQVTVNEEGNLSLANGEYIKVKLSIENYGTSTYGWSTIDFKLGKEIVAFQTVILPDVIKNDITSGETATGYIYFPVTDSDELTYTAANLTDKVTFKIK